MLSFILHNTMVNARDQNFFMVPDPKVAYFGLPLCKMKTS